MMSDIEIKERIVKMRYGMEIGYGQEIVRCKDCKHATMTADGKMCKYCEMDTDDFGDRRDVYHDADWFCADGER